MVGDYGVHLPERKISSAGLILWHCWMLEWSVRCDGGGGSKGEDADGASLLMYSQPGFIVYSVWG